MPVIHSFLRRRLRRLSLGGCFVLAAVVASAQEKTTSSAGTDTAKSSAQASSATEAPGLKWDALSKVYDAKPGETAATFEFRVTNPTSGEIAIDSIQTSCGCTVAELPPLPAEPFLLAAGASTSLRVTLDLHGKMGSIAKTVTVSTTVGRFSLMVEANIPAAPAVAMVNADRARNIAIATSDRQAIFKGDCAKCHAEPAVGKTGQDLYRAVCAICHEAHPRASMIPDLKAPRGERDLAYWTKWVTEGGPGTMMPAFSANHGGPLDAEQVGSLALYLFAEYSRSSSATSAGRAASAPGAK